MPRRFWSSAIETEEKQSGPETVESTVLFRCPGCITYNFNHNHTILITSITTDKTEPWSNKYPIWNKILNISIIHFKLSFKQKCQENLKVTIQRNVTHTTRQFCLISSVEENHCRICKIKPCMLVCHYNTMCHEHHPKLLNFQNTVKYYQETQF